MKKLTLILLVAATFVACQKPAEKLAGIADIDQQYLTVFDRTVYEDTAVVFHQIDEHTWHGCGHLMYNESMYLIEGDSLALLIDAGTVIPNLRETVESLTDKPVILAATHVHPDHTGSAIQYWDTLWMNAADEVNVPLFMPDYKGVHAYLADGQVIDLGGRHILVVFTPGHTPGSTTFLDLEHHYGFSADAFGSNNLLVCTTMTTVSSSSARLIRFMKRHDIPFCFPGHFWGDNLETQQRISDVGLVAEEILRGEHTPTPMPNPQLPYMVENYGVKLNYNDSALQ